MALSLAFASAFFWKLTEGTNHRLVEGAVYSQMWSALVVSAMMAFVATYAVSLGCIPWAVQSEIFRLNVVGLANSASTAINWLANLAISSTFLTLMETITPSGAFGLYAAICAGGWIFCLYCLPETAQLSLDDVSACFQNDFGVKRSKELRTLRAAERSRLE